MSGPQETSSQRRWLLVSSLLLTSELAKHPPMSLGLPSADGEVALLALPSLRA